MSRACTMEQLDDLLAGADITLDDKILEEIAAIVAPGTDVGQLDMAYAPPAIEHATPRHATPTAGRRPRRRLRKIRERPAVKGIPGNGGAIRSSSRRGGAGRF